ncbi:MAG TPA: diguanylate cyclase [Candidatus Udaeobacter sp.]|nr:diguanylate cyclase [Candidatus Udaeobacter sp.]
MTARLWSRVREAIAVLIAGLVLLPASFPLPLPTSHPIASTVLPSPSLPAILPSPSAIAISTPAASPTSAAHASPATQQPTAAPALPRQVGGPRHGVTIPFTTIYVASPLDAGLIAALMVLPLLIAIWLLAFGRTVVEASRAREAHIRLRLAADLGLHPRDLASMSTRKLFRLRDKAAYDELTGVLRAAAGIGAADREISRARRRHSPLTVVFIDVDGLQEANESGGRTAGDALLRRLVQLLQRGLRGEDVLMRYAGDEFVCVLPETGLKEARSRLDEVQLEAARSGIRFSAGLAALESSDDVVSLFARADRDLYEFKTQRGEIVQLPRQSTAVTAEKGTG